ncbi:MAG TPA: sigma-70 family RNA polymerase sigma factor [Flavitalea sp.]|nr:sigma-70 family RNA polymerase sigma factor [Flavitalea sp.]
MKIVYNTNFAPFSDKDNVSVMDVYLIEGIQRNDEAIFSTVYKQYEARLYFYFRRNAQSGATSANLVQTTFIKCWNYRKHLSQDIALSHQLFRIAKTTLIDLLRQKANDRLVSLEGCTSVMDIPDAPASSHYRLDEVNATLDKISPERSKIIKFRLKGLTNKEIAEQLGISKKTVENQLNKAVKEIRIHIASATNIAFPFLILFLLNT